MSRIQDIISLLRTPSQGTRDMLGTGAKILAAGYLGGAQGIEAVGKFADLKRKLSEERRLEKIAETKRKLEEARAQLEMDQARQQIAESKARIARENEYKKAVEENLRDQQFHRQAKTGLESAKLMMGAMGLGGWRGGYGGRVGMARSVLSKKTPQGLEPPIVSMFAPEEKRTEKYQTYGANVARELIDRGVFDSYQEFLSEQPRLLEALKREAPDMTPQDIADIDREMKSHFAQAFRPDIAERMRDFRVTGEGLEPPSMLLLDRNMNYAATVPSGALAGAALGMPFGPVGMALGGLVGGLVGYEAGAALPENYLANKAKALVTYQPAPGSGRMAIDDVAGKVIGGRDAIGANPFIQSPYRRPVPRRGYGL